MSCQFQTDLFRQKLGKLPDMEKLLARVYAYSVQHRVKAVYFENVSAIKLKDFKNIMASMKSARDSLTLFNDNISRFRSKRLKQLLTLDSQQGLIPS